MTDAARELAAVRQRMAAAEKAGGRATGSVELVAVSKTFAAEAIRPVLEAGQRVFGENRVQEAQGKWPALREEYPDLVLHLIGPLQSNKAADAVALFDVIETVDRDKIARELSREMERQDRHLPVYVQVNIGVENQKAGISPAEAVSFAGHCRDVHGLEVAGLMCIPPLEDDPAPYFRRLRELAREAGLSRLSMGMSGDFTVAISEGATSVRVGSAIFGGRA